MCKSLQCAMLLEFTNVTTGWSFYMSSVTHQDRTVFHIIFRESCRKVETKDLEIHFSAS